MKYFLVILSCLFTFNSIAQWQQTNGPFGGRANAVTANGSEMYAGFDGGGIYYSSDGGNNWANVSNGISTFVNSVTIINNTVIAGCNPDATFGGTGGGVYVSNNHGTIWTHANGLNSSYAGSFFIDNQTVYVGTTNGISKSIDYGYNWIGIGPSIVNYSVNSIVKKDSDLFIGTNNGIYMSSDSGTNWTQLNNGLPGLNVFCLAVKGNDIYAGILSHSIVVSHDNGLNWIALPGPAVVLSMAIIGNRILAGSSDVYYSDDEGANWTPYYSPSALEFGSVHSIFVQGQTVYKARWGDGSFHGAISMSTDSGTTWIEKRNGLTASTVFSMENIGDYIFAGTLDDGVFLSTNNGLTWQERNNGLINSAIYDLKVRGADLYAATLGGGVSVSYDSGMTWNLRNNGFTNLTVYSIAVNDSVFYSANYDGVFVSSDFGMNWVKADSGLPANTTVYNVTTMGHRVFAMPGARGIYYSDDNGHTWNLVSQAFDSLIFNYMIQKNSDLYLAGQNGIYLSTDTGLSWNLICPATMWINNTQKMISSGSHLFVCTWQAGISISSDSGYSWSTFNAGLNIPSWIVWSMTSNSTKLFAGGHCSGVWTYDLNNILLNTYEKSEESLNSPAIYPNPAVEKIQINFHGIEKDRTIEIYNLKSQHIKTIKSFSSNQTIDMKDFPAGNYFIQINEKGIPIHSEKINHIK